MDGADAVALLNRELGNLLALGQLVTRGNASMADIRAFRRQLLILVTSANAVRDSAPADLDRLVRLSQATYRTLDPVRIQGAVEVRRLMKYARVVRTQLAGYQVPSAAPVVPISTGRSSGSTAGFTAVAGAAEPADAKASDTVAPSAGPVYEPRYLVAKAPAIVGLRTTFTVIARIDVRPSGGNSATIEPMNIPAAGLVVSLHAVLQGDSLELAGLESCQFRIFAGMASGEVAFQFKALRKGPATIALRAYVDQAFRGELALDLEVDDRGVPEQQECKAEIAARKPPLRQATLEIEYQASDNAYRFLLRGLGSIGNHKYYKQLTAAPGQFVADLMAQINAAVRNRWGQHSDAARENLLKGIGTDLWAQILPPDLQAKLVAHWDDIDRLELLCGEEPLPWELLYCQDRDAFMADHWLVFRWMYGAPAPFAVGTGPACYVMALPPLPSAEKEVQAARAIYPSSEIWTTVDQVIAGLKKGDMGLLHFAAHNLIHYPNAGASAVQLDGPYSQSMLAAQKKGSLALHPLVFLNACSSAAAAEQLVGCASWAGRFLSAGAGAFIGSMWEIGDRSACGFSEAFYRQTQSGSPLGEAFRQARATLGGGDPTRFAYTFFGDPDAALSVTEH